MKNYRDVNERYKYSEDLQTIYNEMLLRLKPNRIREGTFTGPPSDGKTPFIDVFSETKGEPYPIRLAKAIVRSWMVTEPVLLEKDYLIGFTRPNRPVYEHFSFGIMINKEVLDHPSYSDRKDALNDEIENLMGDFYPLNIDYVISEAKNRFPAADSDVYERLVDGKLWWVGGYQGHTVPNYDILLTHGIEGVYNQIEERLSEENDDKKIITLQACKIILEGMRDWILLQADTAEQKAASTLDEKLSSRYKMIAENCRHISFHKPNSFWQAAQLVWFYTLWDAVDCLGRMDQYLYPFFADAVREDRTLTEEICASLMMKFLEHGIHNITVGGVFLENGKDASNDLTFLLLQILRYMHETHPRMTVRISDQSDPALMSMVVQMWSEGMSDPTVASDSLIISSFVDNYGVKLEDARNYSALGCQELEIPGKSNFGCEDGQLNLAKILELTLNDGKSRYDDHIQLGLKTGYITDYDTFEDLWDAYERQMRYFTKHFLELCNMGQEIRAANYAKLVKTPFTEACIERGLHLDEGGAVYNFGCIETAGSSVVADSFTAIKKLVYEEGVISRETLKEALDANFVGYERERQILLNQAPKYGNDDNEADAMAVRVLESFWNEIRKYKSVRGDVFTGACSLLTAGITYGEGTWATPDGRLAGRPLGNSIGPRPGADKNGLTSMLNSCAKLPLEYGLGGTTCNILIPVSLMDTDIRRRNIEALIKVFLENGGQLGQITTTSLDELLDAKIHPEEHQNLIIRVGGFSIKFCELSEAEMDEVISRYTV